MSVMFRRTKLETLLDAYRELDTPVTYTETWNLVNRRCYASQVLVRLLKSEDFPSLSTVG